MDQGRRLRNRSPFRARSMRQGGQWTPALLNPFAWYDAHAGGSSTQITDKSANARAAATFGAAGNAPLFLPYTGIPYLHLEAAAAGTNSLSCTAPANTASYSAAPLGGGAASTGAAAAGAFTFTTAGDWLTVELLDAGANVLARYRASDSTQTGHTDAFAVAWTVNRGTAGRKSVVQSSAARSDRSVVLFGTDDRVDVPAAAIPPMLAASDFTVVMVGRQWATPVTNGRWFDCRASTPFPGLVMTSGTGTAISATLGDGTNSASPAALTQTYGTRYAFMARASAAGQTFGIALNNGTPNTASAATVGNRTGLNVKSASNSRS